MNAYTPGDAKPVDTFDMADSETDTYERLQRSDKEKLSQQDVEQHWNARAQRQGVQSVMSARHTQEENEAATSELQKAILEILGDRLHGNILELGTGIGRMTELLAKKAEHVTSIDLSPLMLERAKANLSKFDNVDLRLGRLTELAIKPKSFDLAFESIVLLHILNPEELRATARKLQETSKTILIVEHTYEGPNFGISKYSILRKPEEYEDLFKPYRLIKSLRHRCAGDCFTLMLFESAES